MTYNILISEVQPLRGSVYLPYIYATLKTYSDTIAKHTEFNWLDPLYGNMYTKFHLLNIYDPKDIDIFGISCYEWNWKINLNFAKLIKERNPNCLIVAGGPHPNWNDDDIFKKYPFIDIIVKGDGEEAFSEILTEYLNNKNYQSIEGLLINQNRFRIDTGTTRKFANLDSMISPFVHNEYYLKDIVTHERGWFIWETNKGCPYGCTFCDWGSATNQKIRNFEYNRLIDEIEWFGKHKVHHLFLSDANFGIFKRDEDIVDKLIETKEKYGFPRKIMFNLAKNNTIRLGSMLGKLFKADMIEYNTPIALQTTNEIALKNMKRFNASNTKTLELIKKMYGYGMTPGCALIVGCPGETIETWFKAVTDVYELGIHNETRIYVWQQLPNSPSNQIDYINEFDIKSIRRFPHKNFVSKNDINAPWVEESEFLISHNTMSIDDFIEMYVFSQLSLATHTLGLTKLISQYLRHTFNISYYEFYTRLFKLFKIHYNHLYEMSKKHYYNFINNKNALLNIDYSDKLDVLIEVDEYLFLEFAKDLDRFLFLIKDEFELEDDIINFQKMNIFHTHYEIKTYNFKYNWFDYFDKLLNTAYQEYNIIPMNQKIKCTPNLKINTKYNKLLYSSDKEIYFIKKIIQPKSKRISGNLLTRKYFKIDEDN